MRRTRSEWTAIVGEFERGDETHAEFCARRRLNLGSFRAWVYRLRKGGPRTKVARSATTAVRLLPVRVRPEAVPLDPGPIDLLVREVVVRVRVGADVAYVAELVAALASRC